MKENIPEEMKLSRWILKNINIMTCVYQEMNIHVDQDRIWDAMAILYEGVALKGRKIHEG